MNKKEKTSKINEWFKEGKINKLGNNCFSIPSESFILGITASLVNEVLKGGKNENF